MSKPDYNSSFIFFHCLGRVLFILSFLSTFDTSVVFSQPQTLVIAPGPTDGKGALIRTDFPTTPLGITDDFTSNAWTVGGTFVILRSLIYFDVSVLPANTTITSAILSLYCNLNSGYYQLQSGDNQSNLLVVTQNWDKNTVTWNNQPTTTLQNLVLLPTSASNTQDYPNINVTVPVQQMVTNPSTNYGWMIRLITEQTYRSMVFASFANPTVAWRPILTIVFPCPSIPAGGNITGPTHVCPGDSGKVYTVPPIPGATGYSWTLPPGALITAGDNTNTITVRYSISATSGNITVHGTNLCATGPPSPPLHVTVGQFTVPTITGPDSACVGQTGLIYSTEPGKTNYVWTITAGGIITGGLGTDSITVTWNTSGSQKLTVNYLDTGSCANPNPAEYHIRVNPHPVPTIYGNNSLCIGSGYADYLTDSGMFNYLWSVSGGGTIANGQGTDHIQVTWNVAGLQWVSVTYADSLGCTPVDSTIFNVWVYDLPDTTGNIYGPSIVCSGMNNISYSVAPVANAISYSWTLPSGTIISFGAGTNSIEVDFSLVATSGDMTAYATNLCGNGEPCPPFYITVAPIPTADAGPNATVCTGTSFTVSQASASNYSSLSWTSNGTGTLIDYTTLSPTYIPASGETGIVELTLTVGGIPPCGNDTSLMTINFQSKPTAFAGTDINSCDSLPVLLEKSVATNYSFLIWTTSGTGTFNDPAILHPEYYPSETDVLTGQIVLTLTAIIGDSCPEDSSSLTIVFAKQIKVNAGADASICQGQTYHIPDASAENFSSLLWIATGDGTFNDPHLLNPVYSPGNSDILKGNVVLALTVSGFEPCAGKSDSLTLVITGLPLAQSGPDGVTCQDEMYSVHGASAENFRTILWDHNGLGNLTGATTLTPIYHPGNGESGDVLLTLKVFGIFGCKDTFSTASMVIHIYKQFKVYAGPDQSILYATSAKLSGSVDQGSGTYAYDWEPAALLTDNTTSQPETVILTADTTFTLTITDLITGCRGSDSVHLKVTPPENAEDCIVIHNVITPNGDGLNDTWIIDCIEEYPNNKVELFNRWGDKVHTFENYNNTSEVWKGTNQKGDPLPDGTYYYLLTIKNGSAHSGWVILRAGSK